MSSPIWRHMPSILTFGGDIGAALNALSGGIPPTSAVFPAANDAILVPFYLHQNTLIKRLCVVNGNAVSGNIDAGIYTKDGALITAAGSTAQSGTNAPQFFNITDFMLGPGKYYFAVAMNNTTGTVFRANLPLTRQQAIGVAKMASAFPLPSTITFATVTATYLPLMGAEVLEIL